eukprot:8854152-Pyramimonas_sp.AAC.1
MLSQEYTFLRHSCSFRCLVAVTRLYSPLYFASRSEEGKMSRPHCSAAALAQAPTRSSIPPRLSPTRAVGILSGEAQGPAS